MTNLQERIKIAEQRLKEAEERRERFITKYMENTENELYRELANDEEERIMRIRVALSDAYIKLREEKK